MKRINTLPTVLALTLPLAGAMAQVGSLDTAFMPHVGPNSYVNAIVVQPDGKTVFGGSFTNVNFTPLNRLARADTDGNVDPTFAIGSGPDGVVNALALQGDGTVLIAGSFTDFNGTPRRGLARLTASGSLDTSFNPGSGTDGEITFVAWLTNGQVMIQGDFTSFNGTPRLGLARLNANGSLDTAYDPGARAADVMAIACHPDGRVVLSAAFTGLDGVGATNIARLNADGSLDTNFCATASLNRYADSVSAQADGQIVISGLFTNVNGVARSRIARLNVDGSLDTNFNIGTGFNLSGIGTSRTIRSTAMSDGTTLVYGWFSLYNGTNRNGGARLLTDGSLDTAFNPGWGTTYARQIGAVAAHAGGKVVVGDKTTTLGSHLRRYQSTGAVDTGWMSEVGANSDVQSILQQPDGNLILGGWFTSFNNAARFGLVRLNSAGKLDSTFTANVNTNAGVTAAALQPDGKVIVAGDFITINGTSQTHVARLKPDGSLDTGFASSPSDGPDSYVYAMAVLTNGNVLMGGDFTLWSGIPQTGLARLDAAGQPDWNYNTNFSGEIYTMATQPDGKVLVGGDFIEILGAARTNVARLNADGSLDAGFIAPPAVPAWVGALAVQADGKILVAGDNGSRGNAIIRLLSDGSLDTSFASELAGTSPNVIAVVPQRDGRIVIAGSFYLGGSYQTVGRLNPNGSWDPSFTLGTTPSVNCLALQSDTQLLVGGGFSSYKGLPRGHIARLVNDVSAQPSPGVNLSYFTTWAGSNAVLTGYAAGLPPMTYQWQCNGANVPGQTNLQCALSNLAASDTGLYTLVASNANGAVASAPVRLSVLPASARPGTTDTAFNAGSGPDGGVWHIAEQADGKLLVAGGYTMFNAQPHAGFVRLLPNGATDPSFTAVGAIGGQGFVSVPLPDGKIVVGGWFTNFNGEFRYNIARIETNGALDASFTARIDETNGNAWVWPMARQADGKLVVGGLFGSVNGESVNNFVRLNPDGSTDHTFTIGSGPDNYPSSIAIQPDGKILVGGLWVNFDGAFAGGIIRLNTNGTRDASFATGTALNGSGESVVALALQPDGKILLGGSFLDFNSVPRTNLVRLNADGSVDAGFKPAALAWLSDAIIYGLALQPDGKVIFGAWPNSGSMPACVARLNPDGSLDASFHQGFCSADGVWCMTRLASGRTMAGGGFPNFNGAPTPYLAQLHGDEPLTPLAFSLGLGWSNGQMQLGLFGESGRAYAIEAATILPLFAPWTNITSSGTNWLPLPLQPAQFFRAWTAP